MRLIPSSTIMVAMTFTLTAQAPTQPALTLTIPGFPDGGQIPVKFSQAAPGVAATEACFGGHPEVSFLESYFRMRHKPGVMR
jgi:hypothetical protein